MSAVANNLRRADVLIDMQDVTRIVFLLDPPLEALAQRAISAGC